MYITVLIMVVIFLVFAIWELAVQKGSSGLKEHNERLPKEIKEIEKDYRARQRSWERKSKLEANRLKPLNDKKNSIEARIRTKVNDWMSALKNRPNT